MTRMGNIEAEALAAVEREGRVLRDELGGWFHRGQPEPPSPAAQAAGHGHVTPRPDGLKARCGGPAICPDCAAELAALQPGSTASQAPAPQPVNVDAAAPAARTTEEPMGFITDLKAEFAAGAHEVAAKAAEFEQTTLPAIAAKLGALEGNPVVDALLAAAHVPPEDLDIVVAMINKLEAIWNPGDAVAPVQAAQQQPEPVPAQ